MHSISTQAILLALLGPLVGTACGGGQNTAQDDTVQMKAQAVSEIEEERAEERRQMTAEFEDVAPPVTDEELVVEMFEVKPGQPARAENGLEIRMVNQGSPWAFEFNHHGRKTPIGYAGAPLYIEGHVYGSLYVISQLGDVVQVTLRAEAPEQRLSAEQAFDLARRERASRLGCDGAREETAINDNGTAVLRMVDASGVATCQIVVGLYTQQVVDL